MWLAPREGWQRHPFMERSAIKDKANSPTALNKLQFYDKAANAGTP